MRRWISTAVVLLLLAAAGAGLVIVSGVIDVGASGGHWRITDRLLHFAMRRSVATHAIGIEVPGLDDPALVRRGAGHYASGCAPCHGGPGVARSVPARQMLPPPPYLPPAIDAWEPAELFWIVRHGVKLTGMPAWPALQREDEVWAMVAFLRELPRLDAAAYRELTEGPAAGADPQTIALAPRDFGNCVRCHGRDGGTAGGAFPRIGGQSEAYLLASLRAFADGRRHGGMMQTAVAALPADALPRLAAHYAAARPREAAAEAAASSLGEDLVRHGAPADGVPPCMSCHGLAAGPLYPHYPSLAGQPAGYIVQQIDLLRRGVRGGTPYVHIMRAIAERLSDAQARAAAAFYAGLQPEAP
jgi:cytochrome c553